MYGMNEIESERWYRFRDRHEKCPRRSLRQMRSLYYECHPTQLGTGIIAVCPQCGKREDITDYGCW